jgi:predicted TPR repeat methyltransferase
LSAAAPFAEQLRAATQLVHAGRFAQAEAAARQVLAGQPRNAQALYVLALSALFQQRHADALPFIGQAAALDGGNAQYPFVRGLCLMGAGRAQEAVDAYRAALDLRPDFFEAWANLGNVLESLGRHPEAEQCYARALLLRPADALVLNGYGMCLRARGDLEQAAEAFRRAVAASPAHPVLRNNLGNTLAKLRRPDAAIDQLLEAVRLRPTYMEALINLGEVCFRSGRDAEALAAIERALALEPDNGGLRHLRDSIAGIQTARAPDEYIRHEFDRLAATFDKHLVEDLEYRTPQRMVEFLGPWLAGREGTLRIVDLGCGTGLSGGALKPWAARLTGVDLSPGMLERARERGLYDRLAEGEVAAYLDAGPEGEFDLAAAMDVFVYLGDLDPVFRAVRRALAPGGLFAFSVERLDGQGQFHLQRSGRYAHSRAYLQALGRAHGLVEWRIEDTEIRKEVGEPVAGLHAAFSKP